MRAVPVTDSIWWVGAIDWNLRDFHGYETPHGTTYNAYLVTGADKTALVDTVKLPFVPDLLGRIREVMPLDKIDYIVVNHIEPDHNSGLRAVMEAIPGAKVVGTATAVKGIAEYHGPDLEVSPVGADDSLDLGGLTLKFLPMPMVHWPDSMFTYCPERCTLMPNDAFGQHFATSARFADEVGLDQSMEELVTYFANILMPLQTQVAKAVDKIVELGWTCEIIAPSHGVIWRDRDVPAVISAYDRFTKGDTFDKLVVAYSTMWGSTEIMARAIADGCADGGVEVRLYDLAVSEMSTITRHLFDSRGLILGSSALHRGMLYRVAGYLQYLAGLHPHDKMAGVFGSYGWSSGATKQMKAQLETIGFELPFDEFTLKYRPDDDQIRAARDWGSQFAKAALERGNGG